MNLYAKKRSDQWLQGNIFQKVFLKIIIVLLVIVFLNIFQGQVRGVFYTVSSPVSSGVWSAGNAVSLFFENLFSGNRLGNDNNNLKKENQELLGMIANLEDQLKIQNDSAALSEQLGDDHLKTTLVRVIGLDLSRDTMIINKGSDEGMKEHMPLVSSIKAVYGRITQVQKDFSIVSLISAQDTIVNVKVQSADSSKPSVYGALKGLGSAHVFLDLVDSESLLETNNVLVTSGLEGLFPPNLLVGTITTVNKSDVKPFQTAKVVPFFNLSNLEHLFVITNYLQP